MPLPLTDVFSQALQSVESLEELEALVADMPEKYEEEFSGEINDRREEMSDAFDGLTASEIAEMIDERPELKDKLRALLDSDTPEEDDEDEDRCECGKKPASECDRGEDCPLSEDTEDTSGEEDTEDTEEDTETPPAEEEESGSVEDQRDDEEESDEDDSDEEPEESEKSDEDDDPDDDSDDEDDASEQEDDVSGRQEALDVLEDARPYLGESFASDMESALQSIKAERANAEDSDEENSDAVVETLCSAAERLGAEDIADDMTPEEIAVMIDSLAGEASATQSHQKRSGLTPRDLATAGGLL